MITLVKTSTLQRYRDRAKDQGIRESELYAKIWEAESEAEKARQEARMKDIWFTLLVIAIYAFILHRLGVWDRVFGR